MKTRPEFLLLPRADAGKYMVVRVDDILMVRDRGLEGITGAGGRGSEIHLLKGRMESPSMTYSSSTAMEVYEMLGSIPGEAEK